MQFLSLVSLLAVAALAVADRTPPVDLVIDRTFVPYPCTVTAEKGDRIEVHYVRLDCSIILPMLKLSQQLAFC